MATDALVDEKPVTAANPKAKKEETLTLTMTQLQALIASELQKQATNLRDGQEAAQVVGGFAMGKPKAGRIVPPGYVPPEGWQLIKMLNGTLEEWPESDKTFNPLEKQQILKLADERWAEMTRVIPGEKPPAAPKRMLVNERFAELFPNLIRWGDDCVVIPAGNAQIEDVATGEPLGSSVAGSKVRFKFVR